LAARAQAGLMQAGRIALKLARMARYLAAIPR
jgi:hypothetical protein